MKEKLRTLKDIEIYCANHYDDFSEGQLRQLRQEAIKRAKKYIKERDKFEVSSPVWIMYQGRLRECMEFSDLLKRDLKENKQKLQE